LCKPTSQGSGDAMLKCLIGIEAFDRHLGADFGTQITY
jgi:hypothetical protein